MAAPAAPAAPGDSVIREGGIIYEVNLEIDADTVEAYMAWLKPHIGELLEFEGFLHAEIMDVDKDPSDESTRVKKCVQYRLSGRSAIDAYIRDKAPKMRSEGIEKFGSKFSASRRIMATAWTKASE